MIFTCPVLSSRIFSGLRSLRSVRVCVRACVRACVHACVCVCACVHACACACVCMRAYVRVRVHVCVHIHVYVRVCVHVVSLMLPPRTAKKTHTTAGSLIDEGRNQIHQQICTGPKHHCSRAPPPLLSAEYAHPLP